MTPLALSGKAVASHISPGGPRRRVLRLRTADSGGGPLDPVHDVALVRSPEDLDRARAAGFTSVLSSTPLPSDGSFDCALQVSDQFAHLSPGDVLGLDTETARFRVLFRQASRHNSFLVTERCNNYCLMCSQPPKSVDDGWILDEIAEALGLIDPETPALTFTGGEPLTEADRFLAVLESTKQRLPKTAIHVLTNGRAFADPKTAAAWAAVDHPNLSAGIPVYAAVDQIHDHVVQARGAFDETILGILRLKDQRQRVEIRLVLHALTAPRLRETAAWFARNLPFVDHVALMGLENTGFAIANDRQLWIDPLDYQADLAFAVDVLAAAGVRVSIYNLPLCVLAPSARPHAVQSISDWKNAYVAECDQCSARSSCAGFFSSGRPKFSRGVAPIR